MTRQFAIDDYKAIRERLGELRPQLGETAATAAEPNWNDMTRAEISKFVANRFYCQSAVCGPDRCGSGNDGPGRHNGAVVRCWAAGKCMTTAPCNPPRVRP